MRSRVHRRKSNESQKRNRNGRYSTPVQKKMWKKTKEKMEERNGGTGHWIV